MTRSAWSDTRLLAADLAGHHRGRLARAGLLALAVALVEGFGIVTLVPVLAFALAPAGTSGLALADRLFAAAPPDSRLALALTLFLALMSLRALLLYARGRAQIELDAAYQADLRLRATAALAARGWRFAASVGQPGMQAMLHNDVPRCSLAVIHALQGLVALLLLLVQAALAALLSWPMTLAALGLAALGAPLAWIYTRRAQASGRAISASFEASSRSGMTLHSEIKAALAQASVARFLADYRRSLGRVTADLRRFGRDQSAAGALFGLLAALSAAVLAWAALGVAGLSLPVAIGLLILFARMNGPVQTLFQSINSLAAYAASFRALVDRLGPLGTVPVDDPAGDPLDWRRLELSGVSLAIGGTTLLDRVDLALEAGEWLALEGPSGAGKTSLVDLVAGLYPPSEGSVRVDGQPLDGERLRRWQRGLSYVGQDEMIFDASLYDNLHAGVGPVAPGRLAEALAVSGLDRLVASWPEGLDLPLADRGTRLSGGERQRVGIARALLRGPRLLILDEATSALDLESEAALLDRLRRLDPRPALLLVSHRPQTRAECDARLVVDRGLVVRQPRFIAESVEQGPIKE